MGFFSNSNKGWFYVFYVSFVDDHQLAFIGLFTDNQFFKTYVTFHAVAQTQFSTSVNGVKNTFKSIFGNSFYCSPSLFFPHTPAQYNKLNERIVLSSYEPLCGQVMLVVSLVFSWDMASIKKSYYFCDQVTKELYVPKEQFMLVL